MTAPPQRRSAVLLVLLHPQGRVLAGERRDFPGCWQFPQGGRKKHESALEALRRETLEEIALSPRDYSLHPPLGTWSYDFPPGICKKKYTGQELTVFLGRWCGLLDPVGSFPGSKEFLRLAWFSLSDFPLQSLPAFKLDLYSDLFRFLASRLPFAAPLQDAATPNDRPARNAILPAGGSKTAA